jgi:hypothetical protein
MQVSSYTCDLAGGQSPTQITITILPFADGCQGRGMDGHRSTAPKGLLDQAIAALTGAPAIRFERVAQEVIRERGDAEMLAANIDGLQPGPGELSPALRRHSFQTTIAAAGR